MGPIVSLVLFIIAVALMVMAGKFTGERGEHTALSFLMAIAAILLVFACVMALYDFK